MDAGLEQNLIGPGIADAGNSRLIGQAHFNRRLAAGDPSREPGEIEGGIERVGTQFRLLHEWRDAAYETHASDAPAIDVREALAVGKIELNPNISRRWFPGCEPAEQSGRSEVQDEYRLFAEIQEQILAVPCGGAKSAAVQAASQRRRGDAFQAAGIRYGDMRYLG